MSSRIRFWGGLVCAMAAAIWWAVGITVIQPLTEPIEYAENNTYWTRDVRWLALLVIVLAFVWSFRGDKRLSAMAAGALVLGIAADVLLDRFDDAFMTSRFDMVEAGSLRWGVYLVVILVPGAWIRARFQLVRPSPRVSMVAAMTAAVGAGFGSFLESPTDREWYLAASALFLAAVLTVVGFGNAREAAKRWGRYEWWLLGVAAVAIAALAVGGRVREPSAATALLSSTALLAAVVTVAALLATAGRWRPMSRLVGAVALGAAGLVLAIGSVTVVITTGVAAGFTALAGNPAVNSADWDIVMSLASLAAGLVLGTMLVGLDRLAASGRAPRRSVPIPA